MRSHGLNPIVINELGYKFKEKMTLLDAQSKPVCSEVRYHGIGLDCPEEFNAYAVCRPGVLEKPNFKEHELVIQRYINTS